LVEGEDSAVSAILGDSKDYSLGAIDIVDVADLPFFLGKARGRECEQCAHKNQKFFHSNIRFVLVRKFGAGRFHKVRKSFVPNKYSPAKHP
jgi:hypothetical protein